VDEIFKKLFGIDTLVFGIILAFVVIVAGSFISGYLERKRSSAKDTTLTELPRQPSKFSTAVNAITAMHAVLGGCAWFALAGVMAHGTARAFCITCMVLVPFGILVVGRMSLAAAVLQVVLTYALAFFTAYDLQGAYDPQGQNGVAVIISYGLYAGASSVAAHLVVGVYSILAEKMRL
jgi:hypothetical protein